MTNQEQTILIAEADYPKAKELAELTSLIQDMDTCINTCQRLTDFMDQENQDTLIQNSLWTSVLIIYARCFGASKKFGITEEYLSEIKGNAVVAHNYFIDISSKHIAHSVNQFDLLKVGLVLSDPQIERRVTGIIKLTQSHVTGNKENVDTLKQLCLVIKTKLVNDEKLCLKEALKFGQELPLEDLYEKSYTQSEFSDPNDVFKTLE